MSGPGVMMVLQGLWRQGGMELQARAMGRALMRRGARVAFVTSVPFARQRIPIPGARPAPVYRIPAGEIRPLRLPTFPLGAAALVAAKRRRIDVVHGYQLQEGGWVAALAGRAAGRPVVVRAAAGGAGGDVAVLRRRARVEWKIELLRGVARAIAISDEIAGELASIGIPERRIVRLPNGVDTERFRPPRDEAERQAARAGLGLPAGPIVLFAGRLVPQKRPDLLVEAFARASASRAGAASLVLLGEGELRPAIEAAARRSSTRVILPGAIRDTAPWLRAADLFVLPSSFEGFPNALLEAAATGLGCIATPVGAVEEVVRDGETGLLAEGTAPALAAAIVRLLDDEPLRARLGAAARAHAAARFGIDGLAASYLGLYTEVVAEHRAAPR